MLGQRYLDWSQQAEGAICIAFLQPEDNARRFIGRGRFPRIVQRPLIGERALPIDAVSSKAVRFWGKVRARITELCKLKSTDKGILQQHCICKEMAVFAYNMPQFDEQNEDLIHQRLWHTRLTNLAVVHLDVLHGMRDDAGARLLKATYADAKAARISMKNWIIESLS